MRFTVVPLLVLPFLTLFLTIISALPTPHSPKSLSSPHQPRSLRRYPKLKLRPRQLEEELANGLEESFELFDTPRVHDSTETIHKQTESNDTMTQHIWIP